MTATTTAGRRGHGEGSIYRTAEGKWRAVVDLGWVDGKRSRKYVTGATRQEVATRLRAMLAAVDQGRRPAKEVTVEAHLLRWVAESLPRAARKSERQGCDLGFSAWTGAGLGGSGSAV